MPRKAVGLTAAKVRTAPPGRYGDGDGLYLLVRSADARFWVFRYTRDGRMREMGLGRAGGKNAVTLVEARTKAGELFRAVKRGIDPLDQRDRDVAAASAAAQVVEARSLPFRVITDRYLAAHDASWKNSKHRQQWRLSAGGDGSSRGVGRWPSYSTAISDPGRK